MRLFLIRHGETVDNVAGLLCVAPTLFRNANDTDHVSSAGSTDSPLTNHGVQQACRLGEWLADKREPLTRVYTSPLQRARKTAEAICAAQSRIDGSKGPLSSNTVSVVQLPQLIEQDFGFYEGKPFYTRTKDSPKNTEKELHLKAYNDDPAFVDVESKDSMMKRCDEFLDHHLIPTLNEDTEHVVAIVSHGILLGNLWRRLLLRLPRKNLAIAPEVKAVRGQLVLEHLGGWSNTGCLELSFEASTENMGNIASVRDNAEFEKISATSEVSVETAESVLSHGVFSTRRLTGFRTTILTVNGKHHLQGLKRTRGGIGRARYDEKQRTMDTFFKRARKE